VIGQRAAQMVQRLGQLALVGERDPELVLGLAAQRVDRDREPGRAARCAPESPRCTASIICPMMCSTIAAIRIAGGPRRSKARSARVGSARAGSAQRCPARVEPRPGPNLPSAPSCAARQASSLAAPSPAHSASNAAGPHRRRTRTRAPRGRRARRGSPRPGSTRWRAHRSHPRLRSRARRAGRPRHRRARPRRPTRYAQRAGWPGPATAAAQPSGRSRCSRAKRTRSGSRSPRVPGSGPTRSRNRGRTRRTSPAARSSIPRSLADAAEPGVADPAVVPAQHWSRVRRAARGPGDRPARCGFATPGRAPRQRPCGNRRERARAAVVAAR